MNMLFADTLKKLRKDKGLSQQALAEKLYVTNAAVSRWESGHRLPDAVMMSRIAGILGADVNILLSAAAQTDELKHAKAYLAVEQAQHEDSLFVEYDTPYTHFSVPPLTLQPLVENAVKHGMNPDGDPLHIFVKTRQTSTGSEIIVENDGPDFNPANDNEPHIALNNIRQRLEMMCKGTLTITRREGGGTAVTVFVPQDRRYNKKQYHLSTGL